MVLKYNIFIFLLLIKCLLYGITDTDVLQIIMVPVLLQYILLLPSFYRSLGRFLTTLSLRAQVGDLRYRSIRYFTGYTQRTRHLYDSRYLDYFVLFPYIMLTDLFCMYSCIYLILELLYIWRRFSVLRRSVHTWGYLRLAYVRRHNVPVPAESGSYRVISEPRFIPGVGNHLDQCSGSYQQYNQILIQTYLYLNLGIPATSTRIHFH